MPATTMLELSTGHLPETERDLLNQTTETDPDFPVRLIHHEYGWLLPVPSDRDDLDRAYRHLLRAGAPAFALTVVYAAGAGARFLYFDLDADPDPNLPWYS